MLHIEHNIRCYPFQVVIVAHVTAKINTPEGNEEKYFLTSTGENEPSPSLNYPYSRELSVVIPAYNEELRSESPGFRAQFFLVMINSSSSVQIQHNNDSPFWSICVV